MHKNSLYYSDTRMIRVGLMLYLSTFLHCKCIFFAQMIVILNKTIIFAVYYSNTRNKYNILIRNNHGNKKHFKGT